MIGLIFDLIGVELGARAQKRWPNSFLPLVMLGLLAIIAALLWATLS